MANTPFYWGPNTQDGWSYQSLGQDWIATYAIFVLSMMGSGLTGQTVAFTWEALSSALFDRGLVFAFTR